MSTKKVVHGRRPSNINLVIFVSFCSCQARLLTMVKMKTNNNLRQFFSSSPVEQSFVPSHTDVARRHPPSLQLNMLEGHSQLSSSEPSLHAKSLSHNRFFLTHSPLLHVNLSSLHLKPEKRSCKECFHSCVQQAYKFIGTKESVYIRKVFNSLRISLRHQLGRRFIVLGHQYNCCDVI